MPPRIECLKLTPDAIRDATRALVQLDGTPEGRKLHLILVTFANQIAGEFGKVGDFVNQLPLVPLDNVWLGEGNDLPARDALGGRWGPGVVGHTNQFEGEGLPPSPFEDVPEGPSGAHVAVLQDARIDPVGHWIVNDHGGASWAWAAKPFICDEHWIHYDSASGADKVEHIGPSGPTAYTGATGEFLAGIGIDPRGHAPYGGLVWESYEGDNLWIVRSGWTFSHTGPTGATEYTGTAGQYLKALKVDARGHTDTAGFTWDTPAGGGATYTGDGCWIVVDNAAGPPPTISHAGPSEYSSSFQYPGGTDKFLSALGVDSKGHFGLDSGNLAMVWTTITTDAWLGYAAGQWEHAAPVVAGATVGGAGKSISSITYDDRGHVTAVTSTQY